MSQQNKIVKKRKRIVLSINKKNEILDEIEKGSSISLISQKYGIGDSTVRDLIKNKSAIRSAKVQSSSSKKTLRGSKYEDVEEAVLKWYKQQRSSGISIRGPELKSAAQRFAERFDLKDFKASEGWLWRFRKRHNLKNVRIQGEAMSADSESVAPFQEKLKAIISSTGLSYSQLYNADETGLYWKSLPNNTQALKEEKSVPGRKMSKERLSALLCSNADGSHRLKSVIVGKSKRPRALKNCFDSLPVVYYSSTKAWFTQKIFKDWFHRHFVPEVRRFQERQNIRKEEIKALLILDNAPAHPAEDELCSDDGHIRTIFLPANTTSILHPMDQGIIEATKRLYRRKMLGEVLVYFQDNDQEDDTRGEQTLKNLKGYSIKSAIFNWDRAWRDVKQTTLNHGWSKLIIEDRTDNDYEEYEGSTAENFKEVLTLAGETAVTIDNIEEWLEEDEADPGYHFMSEEEIADEVSKCPEISDDDKSDEGTDTGEKIKLKDARDSLDKLIKFIDSSNDPNYEQFYNGIRLFREEVVKKQEENVKQSKIHN